MIVVEWLLLRRFFTARLQKMPTSPLRGFFFQSEAFFRRNTGSISRKNNEVSEEKKRKKSEGEVAVVICQFRKIGTGDGRRISLVAGGLLVAALLSAAVSAGLVGAGLGPLV